MRWSYKTTSLQLQEENFKFKTNFMLWILFQIFCYVHMATSTSTSTPSLYSSTAGVQVQVPSTTSSVISFHECFQCYLFQPVHCIIESVKLLNSTIRKECWDTQLLECHVAALHYYCTTRDISTLQWWLTGCEWELIWQPDDRLAAAHASSPAESSLHSHVLSTDIGATCSDCTPTSNAAIFASAHCKTKPVHRVLLQCCWVQQRSTEYNYNAAVKNDCVQAARSWPFDGGQCVSNVTCWLSTCAEDTSVQVWRLHINITCVHKSDSIVTLTVTPVIPQTAIWEDMENSQSQIHVHRV